MGDIIHTLPALTDAQHAIENLEVDWVLEEDFAEIPRWHSAIRNILPVAIRRWRKNLFSSVTWHEWQSCRIFLQSDYYDAVIDAQGLIKSAALITYFTNGIKYGYDKQCAREPIASYFYDKKFFIDYQQHAVERIRQLFAQSLGYPYPQTLPDYAIATHFIKTRFEEPYILFFHTTTRSDKFWLIEEWRNLAQKLTALGYQIRLPWNNEKERRQAEQITKNLKNCIILPKLNLTELATEIINSIAVVSVDTGLAHLTAALDKTNVTLYGATDPKLIGTYGKNQFHLQGQNMVEIKAEEVFRLLMKILP